MTKPPALRVVRSPAPEQATGQEPPHNIAAEQVVLGAVMLSGAALAEVRDLLDGSEFYRPAHQDVWQAITALAGRGAPADPIAVGAELGRGLAKCGGAPYLHTLIAAVPAAANGAYYARIVADLAYARRVTETGARLAQIGHAASGQPDADLRGAVTAECAAITAPSRRGWPDPAPLSAEPDLPPFPLAVLPGWLSEHAAALAEATQTPPDLAGCLSLAVLAVAAGGRVRIQAPAWAEPACLYVVVVLPPGNRKSEVFAAMTAPLRTAEHQLADAARPAIIEAQLALRIADAAAEKTAKTAATADPGRQADALAEASAAALSAEAITIPPEPKLFTANATVEKLTSLLAEQGGRFAVLAPEGKIFSILAGRYSGTPDLEVLLSGHAGEEMRIDRMGRASERIENAALTLGVCMQPGVLTRLGDTPEFREQGLLGRLLYSVPSSLLGYRRPNPQPLPAEIAAVYARHLTALTLTLHGLPEPAALHFTPAASNAVITLLADIEPRFRPGNDLAHMTDWGGKLAGATIRIAGLLHLAEHLRDGWAHPIGTPTLAAARQIGGYFTAHARAAYDTIGADPATTQARAILRWAATTATTRFTTRDLMRGSLKTEFKKAASAEPALSLLETHGWIRRLPTPLPGRSGGRPYTPIYETHPATHNHPHGDR